MQASQKARRGNRSVRSNTGIKAAAQDILNDAVKPVFEHLERRQLMTTVWVNDNWVVTNDQGAPGLDAGDTVADSDPSDNNLVSGKIFGNNAFDTIASGVNAAGSGGTVNVRAGQYSTPTTITTSVTLVGDNTGVSPTSGSPRTLKETVLNASAGSLSIGASNVTIDGFTIRDASTSGGAGVNVTSGSNITIGHNIITANSVGVVINNGVGNFIVSDNLISSNNRAGANRGQGVRVLTNSGTGTIVRNRFSGHSASATTGAVTLNGSSAVSIGNPTDGNQFDSNAVAIRISGAASSNVVRNNNMNPPNTTDLIVESTGANVISTLSGNTFGAATTYIDYAGSTELNATSTNTFGGVNPNGNLNLAQQNAIEDKIVDGIDAAGRGMVLIDPGHVYVTQLSETTNAGAIGRASTLSHSGDTLRITAGNFVDQISITHALSVIGAGNTTVIKPIAALATLFTTSEANKPIIYATGANGVNISQLKVDGNGQGNGNYRFMGIAYNDAGGTISNVTITSIRETPVGGAQHGVSLLINDTATARSVTISNNTISDYQKSGIYVGGAALTASVTGNTVTGVGNTTATAQNGITLTNGATGSITNNIVSGNMYSGGAGGADPATSTQSCGILVLDGTGTISITGNTLDANDIGIYNLGNATISGNTLGATTANRYEGIFQDQGSSTVSGNAITGGNMGIAVYSFGGNTADSSVVATTNTITNAGTSVKIFDDELSDALTAKADISGNSLAGTGGAGTGVDVSGGVARIQNNDLSNHLVGILTSFNANVDAGSQAGDLHPTGFGLSAGNNDLTGYSGTAGSFAIDNENTTPDVTVYARNNNFGPTMTNAIVEQRIIDDSDGGSRTQVIFTPFQNVATPPSVVWVDDDWSSTVAGTDADGAGSNGTTFGYDQFANIQDAIDAVTAGGSVNVAAGTYTQNLVVNKNVQLRGALGGSDARTRPTVPAANESVIIPSNAANPSLTFQTGSGGSGSLLTGFAFSGGGIQLSGASGPIDSMLISGNLFVGFTGSAISMSTGGNNLTFDKNKMDGSSMTGSAPIMSMGASTFGGLSITNNLITNGGANHTGLSINGDHNMAPSVGPGARNPQIMGNTVSFNKDGIDLGSQSFQGGLIFLNVVTSNSRDGLVGGPQDATLRQNTFDSNGRYGMNLTSNGSNSATQGAQRDTIINNFFKVSGSSDLFLDSTQAANTLNTLHINNNSIVSPTGVTYNGTETIDVTNNWWGQASGPTGGGHPGNGAALVGTGAALLDVAPWVRTSTDIGGSPLNGFQPDLAQAGHDAVSISGANTVSEGSPYTVTYAYNGDADLSSVNTLIIDWGDGTSSTTASALASSGTFTHAFADGPSTPTIQMFGVGGGRTYGMYPVKPVTVNNVAPSFTISSAGPNNFNEGSVFTLTVGAVSDPGTENITMYRINWGDGTVVPDVTKATLAAQGGKLTHTYQDDNPAGSSSDINTITVLVQDEDSGAGFHPAQPSQQLLVTVSNTPVAPNINGTIAGTPTVDEGSANLVSFGTGKAAVIVDQYTYNWGITKDTGGGPVSYADSGGILTATNTIPGITFTPNDQGTYVVSLTISDNDLSGPTSAAPRTYIVKNVAPAPTIAPTATTTINEGSNATLTAIPGDPGSVDTFTYAWTITKNGAPYTTGTNSTIVLAPDDNGAYGVTLTVTDNSAASTTISRTITGANVAPTATISGAPASIAEGSPVSLTASQTDPGTLDTTFTYAWTVTKNAAAYTTGTGANFVFTPNDNGTYVTTLTVTDKDAGSGTKTATVIGTNVVPTASIAGTPTVAVNEGSTNVLTAAVTDPGSADTFTYAWTVSKNGTPGYASGTASTFNLVPNDNATYAVSLTVTDDDGGSVVATPRTVTAINVNPSPTINGAAGTKPEGTPITLTANPGDPGSGDTFTYSWSVTKDTGGGPVSYAPSGTASTYAFTPDDNAAYVVSLTVTDDDAGVGSTTSTINVVNVAPTIAVTGGSSLNEGQTYTATLGAVTDPGTDTVTTYRILWGDGTDSGFINTAPTNGSTFTHRYDDGTFNRTITVELGDEDGFYSPAGTKVVTVNNVNPSGTFSGSSTVNLGDTGTVIWTTHSDPSTDDNTNLVYDYDFNNDGTYDVVGSLSSSATVPASYLNTVGPHTIKSQIRDNDGGSIVQTTVINVADASFRVVPGSFTANNSGFSVTFNKSLVTSSLNLYDGDDAASDAPDLIVTSASNPGNPIHGSLVYDPTTNTATWVATGGALPVDTYSLTLVSGANAFTHGGGDNLDGNTSSAGLENYTQNFSISSTAKVVSLPDFTRAAGQNVKMPTDLAAGLPIRIDNPSGVTSVDFNLFYNPQLLTISNAALAAGVPGGWTITPSFTSISPTLSKMFITMSGGTPLSGSASPMDIVSLTASVPAGALYGDAEVLRLENVVVNGTNSRGDYAIHKAAYVGDANRNEIYTGSDKSLIDRVVAGLDSGFDAYQLIDPVVIADVDGNGALQGQDSAWVVQKSLAPASRPEIPNTSGPSITQNAGPDPTIDIPDNITVTPGGTIDVPLNIIDSAAGLKGFNVSVAYDPTKMSLTGGFDSPDVTLGGLFTSASGWSINSYVDQAAGTVNIAFSRIIEMNGGAGTFANLHFGVSAGFTGASTISTSGAANDGGLSFVYNSGSVTTDVLQFRYNDLATPMSVVVTGNYTAGDLVLTNNTTSSTIPTGNITAVYNAGTNVTTFRFPGYVNGTLPDGNYHAVIGGSKTLDFFFLNGDANRDRIVDIKDLNILAANYKQTGRVFSQGDFNGDGVVDAKDLGILSTNWQVSIPGAVSSQPASTGTTTTSTRRAASRAINLTDLQ